MDEEYCHSTIHDVNNMLKALGINAKFEDESHPFVDMGKTVKGGRLTLTVKTEFHDEVLKK